jgi:hypothetical protein
LRAWLQIIVACVVLLFNVELQARYASWKRLCYGTRLCASLSLPLDGNYHPEALNVVQAAMSLGYIPLQKDWYIECHRRIAMMEPESKKKPILTTTDFMKGKSA